jgi:hypothetical protein
VLKVAKNCSLEISRLENKWFNLFRFCYIKDCPPPINSGTELCIHTTSLVVSYACLGLWYLLLCHWKKIWRRVKSHRENTLDLSLFTKHHLQHMHEIPTDLPPINCSSNSFLLQTYTRCLLALLTAVHALFSSKLKHSILTSPLALLSSHRLCHTGFAEGPFVQLCCRKGEKIYCVSIIF